MHAGKTIDLEQLAAIIKDAKAVAKRYRDLTGRPLGITGEVAEYEAARLLGLRLADVPNSRSRLFERIERGAMAASKFKAIGRCVWTKAAGSATATGMSADDILNAPCATIS